MGDKSGIQWTDATWNPTTGCDRVSPGCANCYALTMAGRLKAAGVAAYQLDGDPKTSGPGFRLAMHPDRLDQPLRWRRPRRIFVNSMSDLFHPEVTDEFLLRVFDVMRACPQHTFQVLTKRPERMADFTARLRFDGSANDGNGRLWLAPSRDKHDGGYPLMGGLGATGMPWVWLGTSVENARWRSRIDALREAPARVKFLSCEPLLGPLVAHLDGPHPAGSKAEHEFYDPIIDRLTHLDLGGIDWVIVGGESGPNARPMHENWVRDIVAECREQTVPVFVKQMGEVWSRERLGHGGHAGWPEEWPADLRVREWPKAA